MKNRGFFYLFFRPLVKFALVLFYRKIEFDGKENFPQGEAYIIAPNHQNAFMDALVIACFTKKPIHFLVRADVFKNKIAARVFKSFNMLPIYRERDGKHNMYKNEAIFEKCVHLLSYGEVLMIFPEASHFGKRFLRPLRKGIARIAFDGIATHSHLSELKIIPVGINYSDYFNSHSDLFLDIGKPLLVKKYYQILAENKLIASTEILEELHSSIKNNILHVESDRIHLAIEKIYLNLIFYVKNLEIFGNTPKQNHFYFKNKFIPYFEELKNENQLLEIEQYFELMKKYTIQYPIQYLSNFSGLKKFALVMILIFTFPIYLISYVSVFLPIVFIKKQIKIKVKDVQFSTSFKITAGIFLFGFNGFLYAFILFALFGNLHLSGVYFFFYPVFYLIYGGYRRMLKKINSIYVLSKIKVEEYELLKMQENHVISILNIN